MEGMNVKCLLSELVPECQIQYLGALERPMPVQVPCRAVRPPFQSRFQGQLQLVESRKRGNGKVVIHVLAKPAGFSGNRLLAVMLLWRWIRAFPFFEESSAVPRFPRVKARAEADGPARREYP